MYWLDHEFTWRYFHFDRVQRKILPADGTTDRLPSKQLSDLLDDLTIVVMEAIVRRKNGGFGIISLLPQLEERNICLKCHSREECSMLPVNHSVRQGESLGSD